MDQKQMVWHAFHARRLCQLVDLEARRQEIEEIKPEYELPTRRRLMKPVIGQLPPVFIIACIAYDEACKACDEAYRACGKIYDKACRAREETYRTCGKAREEACRAYDEACKARKEVGVVYELYKNKACKARKEVGVVYESHKDEIESLHAEECPDCPWDGHTIFPE